MPSYYPSFIQNFTIENDRANYPALQLLGGQDADYRGNAVNAIDHEYNENTSRIYGGGGGEMTNLGQEKHKRFADLGVPILVVTTMRHHDIMPTSSCNYTTTHNDMNNESDYMGDRFDKMFEMMLNNDGKSSNNIIKSKSAKSKTRSKKSKVVGTKKKDKKEK